MIPTAIAGSDVNTAVVYLRRRTSLVTAVATMLIWVPARNVIENQI